MATPPTTFRDADSLLLRCVLLCNYFAPIGALKGATVLMVRKNSFSFPPDSFGDVFPVLYYVTYTSLRYRHPLDPVIMLLTAAGIVETGRWPMSRRQAAPVINKPSARG